MRENAALDGVGVVAVEESGRRLYREISRGRLLDESPVRPVRYFRPVHEETTDTARLFRFPGSVGRQTHPWKNRAILQFLVPVMSPLDRKPTYEPG